MVSDLDGTLLNDYKEITPRALRAIAALQRQGIGFTVCTGREYATLDAYASQISPNAPMICNNGAEVIRYPTGEVISRTGLHARPAAEFVARAKQFRSRVTVGRPGEDPVNAKSIIMLMSGAFVRGDEIVISAAGEDEAEAAEALAQVVRAGFGEME